MQFDIFDHSRDVMLRNDVVDALVRRDASAAWTAWQILKEDFPIDDALPAFAVLVDALKRHAGVVFVDHDALAEARSVLNDQFAPAALRVFGHPVGADWMVPLWRDAALSAARLAFRSDRVEDHAAPLWLRAGDWQAAADSVAHIESWRRIPVPLAWMAEARYRLAGLEAVWTFLAELAWLSPRRYGELTRRLADPSLDKLLKQFGSTFEGDGNVADLVWFPAWVLTEKAGLARWLGEAQPSRDGAPERVMRLLIELIGLERQGRHHDVVERRKALRDMHPILYAAYMKAR
jgi:hypothetical protein